MSHLTQENYEAMQVTAATELLASAGGISVEEACRLVTNRVLEILATLTEDTDAPDEAKLMGAYEEAVERQGRQAAMEGEIERLRERTEQAKRALEAIRLIIEERLEADTSPGNHQQMRCAMNIITRALNPAQGGAPAGEECPP